MIEWEQMVHFINMQNNHKTEMSAGPGGPSNQWEPMASSGEAVSVH